MGWGVYASGGHLLFDSTNFSPVEFFAEYRLYSATLELQYEAATQYDHFTRRPTGAVNTCASAKNMHVFLHACAHKFLRPTKNANSRRGKNSAYNNHISHILTVHVVCCHMHQNTCARSDANQKETTLSWNSTGPTRTPTQTSSRGSS